MKITETMKSKFFSILYLTILCSMLASASTGDKASATASMYKQQSALAVGVVVHGGYVSLLKFVHISSYTEMVRILDRS